MKATDERDSGLFREGAMKLDVVERCLAVDRGRGSRTTFLVSRWKVEIAAAKNKRERCLAGDWSLRDYRLDGLDARDRLIHG